MRKAHPIYLLALFLLAGCNFKADKRQLFDSPVKERGLVAFRDSVYPYARNNCIQCHRENRSPYFAQDDLEKAYREAKGFVNFTNIASSTFVVRVRNGHCGVNCQTDGQDMIRAIQYWYEQGEAEEPVTPPPPRLVTEKKLMPGNLPSDKFTQVTFTFAEHSDIRFELDVQQFSPNSYRVRRPRLTTMDRAFSVKDVRILLDGVSDPNYNAYVSVDREIAAWGKPVLSSSTLILLSPNPAKEIAISIGKLEPIANFSCVDDASFDQDVFPLLEHRCFSCHENPTSTAEFFPWKMGVPKKQLCVDVMQRVYKSDPIQSPVITYALRQANDHPVRPLLDDEAEMLVAWFRKHNLAK